MKIKLGGYFSSGVKEYIWIRFGDIAEYEKFLDPYKAGEYVASFIPFRGIPIKSDDFSFNYKSGGVEIPPYFVGENYISLFWGDEDAQWVRDLTIPEKSMFERGVREGLE